MGYGVWGLGFGGFGVLGFWGFGGGGWGVWGVGFGGFGVWSLEFRVWSSELMIFVLGFRFRVYDLAFDV
jgi:hypothetical protein